MGAHLGGRGSTPPPFGSRVRGRLTAVGIGRIRFVGLVVALAAAVMGCDSGSGPGASAPLVFHNGVAHLAVPLSARVEPAVATIGRSIIVFGGQRPGGFGHVRWLDDGAVYDLDTHEWRPMARSPFVNAPLGTIAAASEDALVVVGTPCGVTTDDWDTISCHGAAAEVASYRPSDGKWSTARPVRYPSEAQDLGTYAFLNGATRGWRNGGVTVALEEPRGRVLSVRPDGRSVLVDPSFATEAPTPNSSPVEASVEKTDKLSKPVVRVVGPAS